MVKNVVKIVNVAASPPLNSRLFKTLWKWIRSMNIFSIQK